MPPVKLTEDVFMTKLNACGHLLADLVDVKKGVKAVFSEKEQATLMRALGVIQRKQFALQKEESNSRRRS
jgi:hypothetical protein